jgi:ATP-binding cassette subfamily B protein
MPGAGPSATTPRVPRGLRPSRLRLLGRVLRPYRGWIALAAALGVAGAAAGAIEPLFYRYLLDVVIRATHHAAHHAMRGAAQRARHGAAHRAAPARPPIGRELALAVAGLAAVGLGQQLLEAGTSLSVNKARFDSSFALSRRMVAAVLRQPLAAHLGGAGSNPEESGAGAVMTRMDRGVGALGQLIGDGVQSVLPNLANLALIAALQFALSPALGWLALAPLPPFLWATLRATKAGVAAEEEVQAGWRRIYRRVYEVLGAIKTVKALGGEEAEARRYQSAAAGLFGRLWRLVWVDTAYAGMRGMLATAGRAAVLVAGAVLVMDHRLSAGSWIAAVAYAGMLYAPLTGLTGVYASLSKNWVTAGAALELLAATDEGEGEAGRGAGEHGMAGDGAAGNGAARRGEAGRGPAVARAPEMPAVAIEFDGVSFEYGTGGGADQGPVSGARDGTGRSAGPVLRNLSFTIAPGEIVALVGPSGGGKTTIGDLLLGLYEPTSGAIRADGRDLRSLRGDAWRRQVSAVLQDPVLFDGTIAENIAYGAESIALGGDGNIASGNAGSAAGGAARKTARQFFGEGADKKMALAGRAGGTAAEAAAIMAAVVAAARAAQADGFIRQLPAGYQTRVGERGACLSGGQKQRIAIARALLRDTPVMVLDEASASLDGESEAGLNAALARRLRGRTVLLISHRLTSLSLADRVLVIASGQIVEQGRPADLLAADGAFAALFGAAGPRRRGGAAPAADGAAAAELAAARG